MNLGENGVRVEGQKTLNETEEWPLWMSETGEIASSPRRSHLQSFGWCAFFRCPPFLSPPQAGLEEEL